MRKAAIEQMRVDYAFSRQRACALMLLAVSTFRYQKRSRDEPLRSRAGQRKIAVWRTEYNQQRPHSSLGYRTPNEFAAELAKRRSPARPSAAA